MTQITLSLLTADENIRRAMCYSARGRALMQGGAASTLSRAEGWGGAVGRTPGGDPQKLHRHDWMAPWQNLQSKGG